MSTPWIAHLVNEMRRSLWLARRYWVETLLGLGFMLSLFGGLLLAVLKASGQSLDQGGADGLIVGFAVWLFASSATHGICKDIQEETEQRTLEQLSLAPLPLRSLLALRCALSLMSSLLLTALTLALIVWLTEGRVQFSLGVLAMALAGAPALVGVSFALAGAMLMVKRGELLMVASYPVVMGLVALPAYPVNAWALLPYALSAATARATTTGAQADWITWAIVALNSLVYLALGSALFQLLLARARKLGVLGHF